MNTVELIKVINNIPVKGFTTREETTGYEDLHCEYRYIHRSRRTLGGYLLQKRSSYLLRVIWKTTRRAICSTIS